MQCEGRKGHGKGHGKGHAGSQEAREQARAGGWSQRTPEATTRAAAEA